MLWSNFNTRNNFLVAVAAEKGQPTVLNLMAPLTVFFTLKYCFLMTIYTTRYNKITWNFVHPLCVLYFALGLTHGTQHGANTPWYTKVSSGISENISLPTWLDWVKFLKGLLHSGQPPASSPYSNGGSPASPAGGTEAQVWIKVTL